MGNEREPFNWPVFLLACFAFVWIVHRASVQSVTLDEADTFRYFVATASPAHWEPHSNNHVLNSTLMRLCIWLFGLSHLAVRAPALFGGVLYIVAVSKLCGLLTRSFVLAGALFLCLVYNPFIMDYLVAARGYGLALGFLSSSLYLLARMIIRSESTGVAAISACTGLCICSNFSFFYASSFTLLAAAVVAAGAIWKHDRRIVRWARLALELAAPILLVLFVLAGSALTKFPREQLFWGADSLHQMWRDIREASFIEINPYLVNPLLASFLDWIRRRVLLFLAASCFAYLALQLLAVRSGNDRRRLLVAASLASILALTLLAHWLQFKLFKIPLPLERTSVFLVPLMTTLAGTILSIACSNWSQRAVRGLGIAVLMITGVYFAGELRDSYFREWRSSSEVRLAFPVVLDFCRREGVREVASGFNLTPSFTFYKIMNQATEIDQFSNFDKMPSDRRIYVLEASQFGEFIRDQGLKIAWHGTVSDLVVAVRP